MTTERSCLVHADGQPMIRARLLFGLELVTLASGETSVGRDESCAITIDEPSVSRVHVAFDVSETSVVLRDMGSRNGTRVNGVRIDAPVTLADNDRIRIGSRELVFIARDEEPAGKRDRLRTGKMSSCATCGEPLAAEVPTCPDCGGPVVAPQRE